MKRQDYLALLLTMPHDWILGSLQSPSVHMTETHIKLHAIALRRLRLNTIKEAFRTIESLTKADLANYPAWYKLREEATK